MEFYFLSSVSVLVSIQRTKQDEILEICPLGNLLAYCIAVVLDEACKANADRCKEITAASVEVYICLSV